VQDIRSANKKKKDNQLNKSLQNFMFTMLQDESTIAARKSLDVMIELYNKNIWYTFRIVHGHASNSIVNADNFIAGMTQRLSM